jgi:two-component system, cell cycle response regulator
VTLRARLTAAFLSVVLGPVLLGAVFVGVTVAAVTRARSAERLDLAATGVRTTHDAVCTRLAGAAQSAAVASRGGREPNAARVVIDQELATGVQLIDAEGVELYQAGNLPTQPWADCSGQLRDEPMSAYPTLSAEVEMRDSDGQLLGFAYAVLAVDVRLVHQLSVAAGAAVTLLPPVVAPPIGADPASGTDPASSTDPVSRAKPTAAPVTLSTERDTHRAAVASTARGLHGASMGETADGRYVRRIDVAPGQPLALALSVERDDPQSLYLVLIAVVVATGLLSVVAAWWLAQSTTRPLTELAYTVERVATGDLSARVSVRSSDEVGRLGATFNRMTREMQGYVQALTASRDQLRSHVELLGDTLSSTYDLDRILQVILHTALAATGAQAGVVLLFDPTSDMLHGQCAEGLTRRDRPLAASDMRIALGEGMLGTVAASGEARRGRADRDGPVLVAHEPQCRTYIAVPFAAPLSGPQGPTTGFSSAVNPAMIAAADPDAVVASPLSGPAAEIEQPTPVARGVLALYDRHGFDEFDDTDVATLRTFAGQAAVALDNVRVHKEAERLSLTDPLTGLSNYRFLRQALRREVERASRFGHLLTVLALDVDRFKEVNDTFGHAAGDAVLADFARRLRGEIREVDFAFRQGGEEFVILLPETDAAGGEVVAERLAAAIRRTPVRVLSAANGPRRIPVTVSIGIAVYPDHGSTGPAVLEAADDALYAAKAAGRDTFRLADRRGDTVAVTARTTSTDVPGGAGGASSGTAPPRQSRGG